MITKPTKIISSDASIGDTWKAVSKFIEDVDARQELDAEFKTLHDDNDKEDWFEEEIFDYMNDVVVGDAPLVFGVRKGSGDLGFWHERDVDYGENNADMLDEAIKDYEKYEEELHSNSEESRSDLEEDSVQEEKEPRHVDAEIVTDEEVPEHLRDKEE
jgi:hypothetical protein